jgi:type VI secretion system secreted protein VgrG
LQAEQASDRHSHASGDAISLYPGGKFTLDPCPRGVDDSQFLVLRSSHSLATEHYRSTGGIGGGEAYHGHYEFLPIDQPFRSPAVTPKAQVRGPQTAVVIDGAETDPDGYGRLLVRFHWDRNQNESRRVRVAQVWADNNWGACFFPRVGQEVVVDFLHGDPDQPLVIGAVYNDRHQMPYVEPRSGWKSERNNQIALDDTQGAEELYLRAEKDMNGFAQNRISLEAGMTLELMVGANKIVIDHTSITLDATQIKLRASMVLIESGYVKVSGVLQTDVLIATAVISSSYTPGAGNIW